MRRSEQPSIVTLPDSGDSAPVTALSSVDLPAPFGPTTAVSDPGAKRPEIWWTAGCRS